MRRTTAALTLLSVLILILAPPPAASAGTIYVFTSPFPGAPTATIDFKSPPTKPNGFWTIPAGPQVAVANSASVTFPDAPDGPVTLALSGPLVDAPLVSISGATLDAGRMSFL